MSNSRNLPNIASRDSDSEPRTIVETVYRQLRQDIVSGAVAPGTKLRAEELREKYGTGSSSIREVLARLVADTLVTSIGQRGFFVSPLSLDDFRSVADLRKTLEVKALIESIHGGDDEWESRVVEAYGRLAEIEDRYDVIPKSVTDQWEMRNRDFHRALISVCNNVWLLNFRSILLDHASRYIRLAIASRPIPRDFHREHRDLYQAALRRDADKAAKILEEHIDTTVNAIAQIVSLDEANGANS